MDLAVGRLGADREVIVRFDDPVEPGHVAQVDEDARLGEPQLDQGDEAVAPGQDLGFPLAGLEDREHLVEIARAHIVELTGDHRAASLLPLARAWGPVLVRRGQA